MPDRRSLYLLCAGVALAAVLAVLLIGPERFLARQGVIKVGILHSLSGTMAFSEIPVVDATLLAIDEINDQGGLLGKRIEPVVIDGQSNGPTFAREADRLISGEKVAAIFGCWTSSCRKMVKPVVEKQHHLLFYPLQYEGLEASPYIIYGGQTATQQIIPAVNWSLEHLGRRFYLVGSDYIFPHAANAIIRDQLAVRHGVVVGEGYLPPGSRDVARLVSDIRASSPDVILNTINGDSNIAFFRALHHAGITIPVMSFSISEVEMQQLGKLAAGSYASWSYFQSLQNPQNKAFVSGFRDRYGAGRVINDPMQTAYVNVKLWAKGVAAAGSIEPGAVLAGIRKQSLQTPAGMVRVDQANNHLWKKSRIGRAMDNGQFDIVWESEDLLAPVPFPPSRSADEWTHWLQTLYLRWAGHWQYPGEVAITAARQVGADGLARLARLADSRAFATAVVKAVAARGSLNREEVTEIEQRWADMQASDALMRSLLDGEGDRMLRAFQKQNPDFAEIFVTDISGNIVFMTNKTSDFYQADEQWWIDAYAGGTGASGQEEVEYDASAALWSVPLYRPVRDAQGKVVGIVKGVMNVEMTLPPPGAGG